MRSNIDVKAFILQEISRFCYIFTNSRSIGLTIWISHSSKKLCFLNSPMWVLPQPIDSNGGFYSETHLPVFHKVGLFAGLSFFCTAIRQIDLIFNQIRRVCELFRTFFKWLSSLMPLKKGFFQAFGVLKEWRPGLYRAKTLVKMGPERCLQHLALTIIDAIKNIKINSLNKGYHILRQWIARGGTL